MAHRSKGEHVVTNDQTLTQTNDTQLMMDPMLIASAISLPQEPESLLLEQNVDRGKDHGYNGDVAQDRDHDPYTWVAFLPHSASRIYRIR